MSATSVLDLIETRVSYEGKDAYSLRQIMEAKGCAYHVAADVMKAAVKDGNAEQLFRKVGRHWVMVYRLKPQGRGK